jgi:hypothetical protein
MQQQTSVRILLTIFEALTVGLLRQSSPGLFEDD